MDTLSREERQAKLAALVEAEGFDDIDGLLEAVAHDSVCPGICTRPGCDYTAEVEPDQREGFCEECRCGSIASDILRRGADGLWRYLIDNNQGTAVRQP